MEQLARPGSILLTAATLRLVEGLVQVAALVSVHTSIDTYGGIGSPW
jgi:class 3 adenylate cyclase